MLLSVLAFQQAQKLYSVNGNLGISARLQRLGIQDHLCCCIRGDAGNGVISNAFTCISMVLHVNVEEKIIAQKHF